MSCWFYYSAFLIVCFGVKILIPVPFFTSFSSPSSVGMGSKSPDSYFTLFDFFFQTIPNSHNHQVPNYQNYLQR